MFAQILEISNRLIARHNNPLQLFVAFDNLMHFSFNLGKIIGRKRFFAGKVIIKAVFNGRSDCDLNVRPQFLNRLRHNMRTAVTDDLQAFLVLTGNDGYGCVGSDRSAQILCLAVNGDGQSRLC